MPKEIERRFVNMEYETIKKRIKSLKGVYRGTYLFRIVSFQPVNSLKILRIRDEGFRKTFTIKEKTDKYDIENEVIIDNFDEMRIILNKLGFKEKYEQEKIREIYDVNDCEVIFDSYPGLKPYMEIEAPSEKKLNSLINKLELDMNEEKDYYDNIYLREYGIPFEITKKNFTFKNANKLFKPSIKKNLKKFNEILNEQKDKIAKINKKK